MVRLQGADVLLVDAGGLVGNDGGEWPDESEGDPAERDGPARASVMLEAMSLMGYDAINLGDRELWLGLPEVEVMALNTMAPLVTANVTTGSSRAPWQKVIFKQYKDLTVAVVGLLDPDLWAPIDGCSVSDPAQSLAELMPELKARAGLIVVLAHMDLETALQLTRSVDGINVVVFAHAGERHADPIASNGALLVGAGRNGRRVGRLDLTVDATGRIMSYEGSSITLIEQLGEDESVRSLVDAAGWVEPSS